MVFQLPVYAIQMIERIYYFNFILIFKNLLVGNKRDDSV